jgi:hypothetical protein
MVQSSEKEKINAEIMLRVFGGVEKKERKVSTISIDNCNE